MNTFFTAWFSLILFLLMYNFNCDDQYIGHTVLQLKNASYNKGCVRSGISGGGGFFPSVLFLFVC